MKLLLGLIISTIVLIIVLFFYCALIIAGRSDAHDSYSIYNEGDQDMQICCGCKTGKESFTLDKHSEACPHIGSWKNGKCSFYKPL